MNADQTTINVFAPDSGEEKTDNELISKALSGDQSAMEMLLIRHQPWIYNLSFRMVMVSADAQDVTQEILIKVMTKLSTYDETKASFRTWLYRIVVNHIINMKKRGYEAAISDIESYYSFVAQVPDSDPDSSPETQMVINDIAIGCVMGVMLCLDRKQRIAFLLAIAFNATDAQGSEILGVTKDSFRKLLSRARKKLHEHMNGNCSLINPDAPCQCRKKANGFMAGGAYGPERITFVQEEGQKMKDIVGDKWDDIDRELYSSYTRLLREHPFYSAPEVSGWLNKLLEHQKLEELIQPN